MRRISALIFMAVLLFGCGGRSPVQDVQTSHDYSRPAHQSPNYHPYASRSHVYSLGEDMYVGGDVSPREKLRRIGTFGDITYSMGASRDGVGVNRLENYEEDLITQDGTVSPILSDKGFNPFRVQPKLWFENRFSGLVFDEMDPAARAAATAILEGVQILNDALPPEFQIVIADPSKGDSPTDEGAIIVRYVPESDIAGMCGAGAAACAKGRTLLGFTRDAEITIADNFDTLSYTESRTIIVHEFLHALGIWGHVDSTEFPDSIMGKYADFFPNPGFTIHRIDREALQIMYMSQRTEVYNDWGEWTDTSLHLVGESDDGHVNFGVALFNGLPQPWARGTRPGRLLSEASYLRGSVTWEGALLAFSGSSPIAGDAALTVHMNRLEDLQDLKFRDLYFLNRFERTANDPDRWFPTRNIDYKVTMAERGFFHSSTEGQVVGVFLGPRHEGMAGTLKRTDLVGAFGGTR